MSAPIDRAITELYGLTTCRCDDAWTGRGLHETHCAAEYREDVDTLVASRSTSGEEPAAGNVAKLLLRCEEIDRTTWCADGDPAGGGHIATAEVWRLLAPGRAPAPGASS